MNQKKTEKIELRVSTEDKNFIKNKAKEMGFNTVTAFLLSSAKNHFRLNIDMGIYREVSKEINYVGKNINSMIRRINSDGLYTDSDVEILQENQKNIIKIMNKEYDRLLNLKKDFTSEKLSLKDKKKVIESFQKNHLEIPKQVLLQDVYNQLKDNFLYIGEAIENSPEHEPEISEYVWEYLYGKTLFQLDESILVEFSNKIYLFTEKIRFKLLKLDNIFDEDDWFDFKDILDEYEIY